MSQITASALPPRAFLARFETQPNVHTDCFQTSLARDVSLEEYVNAFFNTWLFRIERLILKLTIGKPSTDADIARLANGSADHMAAWRVLERGDNQLLLEVPDTAVRTWLMRQVDGDQTHLYFGSALLALRKDKEGNPTIGPVFRGLMGFHKFYARALLFCAKRALR